MESRIEELEGDVASAKREAEKWSTLAQRLYRESLLRLTAQREGSRGGELEGEEEEKKQEAEGEGDDGDEGNEEGQPQ